MVDIQGAFAFVDEQGTALERALMRYALGAVQAQSVIGELAAYQDEQGGWAGLVPGCPPGLPLVASCCRALQVLRWLSADSHPMVDRTATYLAGRQHADGYWDEDPAANGQTLAPWMQPGTEQNRLWLTAAVARMLLETGHETEVYFGRALRTLTQAWEAGAFWGRGGPLRPLWMMMPLFQQGGLAQDKPLVEACMVRLWSAVLFEELDAMEVTTVAHAALSTRYAGNHLYLAARNRVLGHQQADGGWATDYGEDYRAAATVDAVMLLRNGGLL